MARCETKRGKPRLVFVSRRLPKTGHPAAFATLDHMVEDDEVVYAPSLCFTEVKGQRSLVFKGLVQQLYSQFFVDCGATHSFVSLDFARANHLTVEPVEQTSATLADGNGVSIHGVLKSLDAKFGAFRAKQDFLVVDIPQYDAVLGMDFLVRHNPLLSFQKRTMTFAFDTRWGHRTVTLQAVASDPCSHHELHSDTFELCSFDALSKTIRRDMSDMHMSKAGPSVYIRLRIYTAHTYIYRMPRFRPYNAVYSSTPSIRIYEIATYGNIRQAQGKVAPPHVQASSRRAVSIHR